MENDIIIVNDHIEIHPTHNSDQWCVVRDGQVHSKHATLAAAQQLAEELAESEEKGTNE